MIDHACGYRFFILKCISRAIMISFFVGYVTLLWGCAASTSPNHVQLENYPAVSPDSIMPSAVDVLSQDLRIEDIEGSFTRIDFLRGEPGELIIRLDSDRDIDWRPLPSEPGRMQVVFSGIRAPISLARVYQLHEFSHPVKNALLRNTQEGSELIVIATGPVSMEPESGPGLLKLRFGISAAEQVIPEGTGDTGPEKTVPSRLQGQEQMGLAPDKGIVAESDARTVFPGMDTVYTGAPISIDLQNIEVEHVLRLISEVAGYNLILGPEVEGRISMKLENVPWDQALDLVLIQQGLGKVQVGNILRITTIERLGEEKRMISEAKAEAARARIVEQELEPLETAYIQINYASAEEMDARIQPFLTKDRGSISHDPRTNMLVLTDVPANIRKIRGVVERLDRPERQVLIEARVVYATELFQRGIGIRWGGGGIKGLGTGQPRGIYGTAYGIADGRSPIRGIAPGIPRTPEDVGMRGLTGYLVNLPFPAGDPTIGIGGFISDLIAPDIFTLDAQLRLGELKGESKTVSSPRIVTLNNISAEIEQGVSIPITVIDAEGIARTEYVDAVLKLTVTPRITSDDSMILDLEVSDDDAGAGGAIERKRAKTKLSIENGQTIVLGGVLKTMEELAEKRVPGAADIPVLGRLFRDHLTDRHDQELLIFIRPTIL